MYLPLDANDKPRKKETIISTSILSNARFHVISSTSKFQFFPFMISKPFNCLDQQKEPQLASIANNKKERDNKRASIGNLKKKGTH